MGAGPFHSQKHGAAPLAADADTLQRPQDGQDYSAPDSDRFVGRYESNEEGCDTHTQERRDQRRLAADPVAVMPKDRCADRAARKADEIVPNARSVADRGS